MSAEALRAVMKHSTARGPELLVQLAIAHLSDSRHGYYPKTTATQQDVAEAARMSLSNTKTLIGRLVKAGRLFVIEKGKGADPNTYELPIKGAFREVLKSDHPVVLESVPLNREDPYTQNSCAGSTAEGDTSAAPSQPSNIVLYPTKKKRGAAAG